MSNTYDLIYKKNKEGIRFVQLSEIFDHFSGMSGVTNKWSEVGNCLFIDYMNVYKNLRVDVKALSKATVKNLNQNTLRKGDVLFTNASEISSECAIASEIEEDVLEDVFMDDHLFGLRLKNESKDKVTKGFLKYIFSTTAFRNQVNGVVRGVTRFYISKEDFMKLYIPIPSIEMQNEIVFILDNFESLIENTKLELKARKNQYEYFKEVLIFGSNYENIKISEVCVVNQGLQIPISDRKKLMVKIDISILQYNS